jgi:hypothetical protein
MTLKSCKSLARLHVRAAIFNNHAMLSTRTAYNISAHFGVLRLDCITNKMQDNLASKLHRSRFRWRMGRHAYLYLQRICMGHGLTFANIQVF